jgi:bacterioferritin-associated ferredoxin
LTRGDHAEYTFAIEIESQKHFACRVTLPMSQTLSQTDPVVCHCLQVAESTIRDCVTLLGAASVTDVREACGAGGGCMGCRRRIQLLVEGRQPACARLPQRMA